MRTWRLRPDAVRTTAAGITPDTRRSITATSPASAPDPAIVTFMPTLRSDRQRPASRLIVATVGGLTGTRFAGGGPFELRDGG